MFKDEFCELCLYMYVPMVFYSDTVIPGATFICWIRQINIASLTYLQIWC